MSESSKTRALCTFLEDRGALVFAVVASRMQEPGWPDRYVAPPGAWLEFKDGKNKPTGKQAWVLEQLRIRGAPAFVVRHVMDRVVDVEDHEGKVLARNVHWSELIDELHKAKT